MILDDRFWSKVEKTDTCWLWTGRKDRDGYGLFCGQAVHRLAYQDAYGPIALGLQVDHRCHVHCCVNPAHLQAVTNRENQENRRGAQANSQTGLRGVSPFHGGWRVTARSGRKQYYGGCFTDLSAAVAAAAALRRSLMTNSLMDIQGSGPV